MKKLLLITTFTASLFVTAQQVGINATGNAPDLSAMLDVSANDKGFLVPRMDITDRNNINNPANGLMVYNTDCNKLNYYDCDTWREVGKSFEFPFFGGGGDLIIGNTNPSENETGVAYSIPPVVGANNYVWTLPNGASVASGNGTNVITVDYTTPGNGYLCVTSDNSCGTQIRSCIYIEICPLPIVAPITGNATPSQNQSGVTYSIAPVTGANSYNWTVPAGATITAGQGTTNITVDFSPTAQNGDICVTATDDCGTSLPQCLTLTMGACPMPNVPVATAETNLTLNDFNANWQAANNAIDYYLDVATDANFTTFLPGYQNKNVGNNLTDNVTGLSCITDYYYRVRAENACGTTISSNVIQVTINPMASTPVATAGTNINATDFDANWNASTNVTAYYIDVSDDAGFSNLIVNNQNVGNVTTHNVSGLTCNTTYYYRVRAENSCGTTGNSNDITVTSGSCCTPGALLSFTNCTATGSTGPSQVQCNNAYNSTPLQGLVTVTSGIQQWTVPATGTYEIEVAGAGAGGSIVSGYGAVIKARISVNQNDVLKILVGQQADGYYGGNASGGNGGSFVVLSSGNVPLIIAGGGGGGVRSTNPATVDASTSTSGNNDSGNLAQNSGGSNGTGGTSSGAYGGAGGGGFSGNGGLSSSGSPVIDSDGKSFLNGGAGGSAIGLFGREGGFGGGGASSWASGGGGGYSGGAGKHSPGNNEQPSGGGGGSYIVSSATNVETSDGNYDGSGTFNGNPITNLSSYRNGQGYVNIQRVCP